MEASDTYSIKVIKRRGVYGPKYDVLVSIKWRSPEGNTERVSATRHVDYAERAGAQKRGESEVEQAKKERDIMERCGYYDGRINKKWIRK